MIKEGHNGNFSLKVEIIMKYINMEPTEGGDHSAFGRRWQEEASSGSAGERAAQVGRGREGWSQGVHFGCKKLHVQKP